MAMTVIWTGMTVLALVCALVLGQTADLASAALEGASGAVTLGLEMAGTLCLWMGVMEVMRRAGLAEKLSHLLAPILRRLFPDFAQDREVMDTISANVSANLLGLGNAATPLGLEAAQRMSKRTPGVAGDSLCMLVVCNTASIQLIPTTVAAVRLAAGCSTPFDILPAVWVTSGLSVVTGILAARTLGRLWPRLEERREKRNVAAAGSAGARHSGRGVRLWHGGGRGRL
jgi:spore maturation protein A